MTACSLGKRPVCLPLRVHEPHVPDGIGPAADPPWGQVLLLRLLLLLYWLLRLWLLPLLLLLLLLLRGWRV